MKIPPANNYDYNALLHDVGTVVDCKRLAIREKPDTNSEIIDVLDVGDKIDVVSRYADHAFYQVKHKGKDGWCMKSFIKIE